VLLERRLSRMSASPITDLSRLCLHTVTTKPWPLATAAKNYAAAGLKAITVWRDAAQNHAGGFKAAGDVCRSEGLEIVSYVRGGFFTALNVTGRQAAIDENKRIIDEAAALGAPLVVLVCGATRGQSLFTSRAQIAEALAAILPHAGACGLKLGIEPLHPMYADSRSAVNTLTQALDLALELKDNHIGVTVDVFHLWWDDRLQAEIGRCGREGKLFSFHICDWKNQPIDMLNDRGLMGEGVINLPEIRGWIEQAGFRGFHEVEIFSVRYWAMDQDEFLKQIIAAYQTKS
jgi:sugar phosphate isomerase/epimerase